MAKPTDMGILGLSKRSGYEFELASRLKVTGKIRLRDEWGALECIMIEPIRVKRSIGTGAATLEFNSFIKVLRCSGGGEGCLGDFNVLDGVDQGVMPTDPEWAKYVFPLVFPGKRLMAHCGCLGKLPTIEEMKLREAALLGAEDRLTICIQIPLSLSGRVQGYAEQENYPMSEIYRRCIERGLDLVDGGATIKGHIPVRGEFRRAANVSVSNRTRGLLTEFALEEERALSVCVIALIGLGLSELEKEN